MHAHPVGRYFVVDVRVNDPVRQGHLIGADFMELFEQVIELRGERHGDQVRWTLIPRTPNPADRPEAADSETR